MAKKTLADHQEDMKELRKQMQALQAKMTRKRKIITKLTEDEELVVAADIPLDDPKSMTKEHWQWILKHWHDDTSLRFETSTQFLMKLGLWTNGIAGTDGCARQHSFSIHQSHSVDKYLEFYRMAKDALVTYPSVKDGHQIIGVSLLIHLFGQDWNHHGHYLEIDPKTDQARFIDVYNRYEKIREWIPLEAALETIRKYQPYELNEDDEY